jgi:hypothetical protein
MARMPAQRSRVCTVAKLRVEQVAEMQECGETLERVGEESSLRLKN